MWKFNQVEEKYTEKQLQILQLNNLRRIKNNVVFFFWFFIGWWLIAIPTIIAFGATINSFK